jgi:hypothetical protein
MLQLDTTPLPLYDIEWLLVFASRDALFAINLEVAAMAPGQLFRTIV